MPVLYKGVAWMREGESLVPVSSDRLRLIFAEGGLDFSASSCAAASMDDLDPEAIEDFRQRWTESSKNPSLANLPCEQLLSDAEALVDGKVTYAALVLFGTRKALGKHLGQAEVVFEFRSSDATGPAQERRDYRQGFFTFYEELWDLINLRNDVQHYQEGLFNRQIPTFGERPVREAILNAVSHRDYQLGGSVFVRQYSRRLEVVSPGGLPTGVTLENILYSQSPRNRRIASIFHKCGLVERSGQGMNFMFEESIREGKPEPDFTGTDDFQVALTLHGTVHDRAFVRFLEQVGKEKYETFDTRDWQLLSCLSRSQRVPEPLQPRLERLLGLGVIERVSRGRFVLARRYYELAGRRAEYTKRSGLDRETQKELLLKHICESPEAGPKMQELLEVLPALSRKQVYRLLKELRQDGKVDLMGRTNGARYYPGPALRAEGGPES